MNTRVAFIAFARRSIRYCEPIHVICSDRNDPEASVSAPTLPNAMWLANFHVTDETAPTCLPAVTECFIAAHHEPHRRMQPISTNQQFGTQFLTIRRAHLNAVRS